MWPSMKTLNRLRCAEMMPSRSALLWVVISLLGVAGPGEAAEAQQKDSGRVGCPQCKNDGSEVSRLLRRADLLYAEFKPKEAHAELLKVLELDPENHEALAKMARVYVEFGDMVPESDSDWQDQKVQHYLIAEEFARKAVKADPNSTWGHFYVAVSLGKIANLSPVSKQVDLAEEIREAVEKAIALDPQNGYAYHVYGVWHRKMAEIGQMSRALASVILWRSIPKGSLDQSVEYLRKAVSINPAVIASRLELGRTYVAMGKYALARTFLRSVSSLPVQFSDDPLHKKNAQQLLQEIQER